MYTVVADKHFERAYKKLPESIKKAFKNLIPIIEVNPFNPSLKTHMLQGNKSHIFSLSVTYKVRALFIIDGTTIVFSEIGSHDDPY